MTNQLRILRAPGKSVFAGNGSGELVDRMRRATPASGSSLPPVSIVSACCKALSIFQDEPERNL